MGHDPFDCQQFHELCMDYRGAPTRPGSNLPQLAYERLQAYCRAAYEKHEPLEFPPIDLGMIPGTGANHPFEPFEYCERN